MELEIHVEDFEYDTGYGVQHGDLYFTVEAQLEHDEDGSGAPLVSVSYDFLGGTFYGIGNNGQELGEVEIDSEDLIARQVTMFDLVLEKAQEEAA